MLAVMVALAYLYLSAGVRMFSTWRQARHDQAGVGVRHGWNESKQNKEKRNRDTGLRPVRTSLEQRRI